MIRRAKLRLPPITPDYLHRPRLVEALDAAAIHGSVIVTAPAGYGKRTLIRHWLEGRSEPAAWLSLDRTDDGFVPFVEYLVHAVRSVVPDACAATLGRLRDAEETGGPPLIPALVDELDAIDSRFILVLEEIDAITDPDVYSLLDQILEHPLSSLCLVLCTRRDLPLSLSRQRTRGQLCELTRGDLAFTRDETRALFETKCAVTASDLALGNLEARVEGWPVALRLIADSLDEQDDPNDFLEQLDAGPRSIERYLEDEVLVRQCSCMCQSLYRASILDRFTDSLWDAVADLDDCPHVAARTARRGRDFGPIRLQLEEGLFLIPLDGEGLWYRYHPMLRRLLSQHLERQVDAGEIAKLYGRASTWFLEHGQPDEAIRHAVLAGDPMQAARIIESEQDSLLNSGRGRDLVPWLEQLPDDLRQEHHGLLMVEAAATYQRFELWKLPSILRAARRAEDAPSVSAERTFFEAVLCFFEGEIPQSTDLFDEVLSLLPKDRSWLRLDSFFFRGLSLHFNGRGDEALDWIESAAAESAPSSDSQWIRLVGASIFIRLLRGELIPESSTTARLLASRDPQVVSWCNYVLGICAFRSHDLARAQFHLNQAKGTHDWLTTDAQVTVALALALQGRMKDAREALSRVWEDAAWRRDSQNMVPLASAEARIALLRGDLESARQWQHAYQRTRPVSRSRFSVEVPEITECRVLAACADEESLRLAEEKLDLLWNAYDAIHYECQRLEIAPLRALVLHRLGERDRAMRMLQSTLEQAEPEGWIRPFVELGAPMAHLLDKVPTEVAERGFVERMRALIQEGLAADERRPKIIRHAQAREGLTNREFDVLELLVARMRDKEIAERLAISPQTVKTHLKSLYRKLSCGNRREAVAAARRLKILPPEPSPSPPARSPDPSP